MWSVQRPSFSAAKTFSECVSNVQSIELRTRLLGIASKIEEAAIEYEDCAKSQSLYEVKETTCVGNVSGSELRDVYENRLVRGKQGRIIYGQLMLLPKGGRCPFCDHRNVATLDHILPKEFFPAFSITPINLVACCSDCNKNKLSTKPVDSCHQILHPYYDDIDGENWLEACVIETEPAAVIFAPRQVAGWNHSTTARLKWQFELFKLGSLYTSQAAREMADIRLNLERHYGVGGPDAVKEELSYQWVSRSSNRVNSWQTALYEALSSSDWYCDGGYRLSM